MTQSEDKINVAGNRVKVGYLCTATPPELMAAAGCSPFRVIGDSDNQDAAEGIAHPNLCGFCKSALAWAKTAKEPFIMVNASSCDGCRRLGPLMKKFDSVIDSFPLDLPRSAEPDDLQFFAGNLRELFGKLAQQCGTAPDAQALLPQITRYNSMRAKLRDILDAVYSGRLKVETAFDSAEKFFTSTPEEFGQYAADIMKDTLADAPVNKGLGVIITGNITRSPEIARAIVDAGAKVVGIDLCNVERAAMIDVKEDPDPFMALAKAVYSRPLCPRFEPGTAWGERIIERAKETGAKAIVMQSLKFCDNTLFSFPSTRRALEKAGLQVLTLEGEYATGLSGQLKTRIEAFLEML